jgi:hypothetical protein
MIKKITRLTRDLSFLGILIGAYASSIVVIGGM